MSKLEVRHQIPKSEIIDAQTKNVNFNYVLHTSNGFQSLTSQLNSKIKTKLRRYFK